MSNKTQLSTNNTTLASLIATLQGKASGGGSLETGTITGVTTLIADPGTEATFYYDLSVFSGKRLVVLKNSLYASAHVVLCRDNIDDDFILAASELVGNSSATVADNIMTVIDGTSVTAYANFDYYAA